MKRKLRWRVEDLDVSNPTLGSSLGELEAYGERRVAQKVYILVFKKNLNDVGSRLMEVVLIFNLIINLLNFFNFKGFNQRLILIFNLCFYLLY